MRRVAWSLVLALLFGFMPVASHSFFVGLKDHPAMVAIDVASSLVAVAALAAIYQYLKRTAGPARWADSRLPSPWVI